MFGHLKRGAVLSGARFAGRKNNRRQGSKAIPSTLPSHTLGRVRVDLRQTPHMAHIAHEAENWCQQFCRQTEHETRYPQMPSGSA